MFVVNAQAPNLAVMEKFAAVVVSAAGTRVALAGVGEISAHDSPPCPQVAKEVFVEFKE